jgi:tetratricopeptide (TPR) repeat protein
MTDQAALAKRQADIVPNRSTALSLVDAFIGGGNLQGALSLASQSFEAAVRAVPITDLTLIQINERLGQLYFLRGEFGEAVKHFRLALEAWRLCEVEPAATERGLVYQRACHAAVALSDDVEAFEFIEHALLLLDAVPDHPSMIEADLALDAALIVSRLGRDDLAEGYLRRSCEALDAARAAPEKIGRALELLERHGRRFMANGFADGAVTLCEKVLDLEELEGRHAR